MHWWGSSGKTQCPSTGGADRGKGGIPLWNGDSSQWRRYKREVGWIYHATKKSEREYLVARLLPGLSSHAKTLIARWPASKYERQDGVEQFLKDVQASYLVKQAMPDAAQNLDDYHHLKRRPGETTTEFLIREEEVHDEYMEAMTRLRDEAEHRHGGGEVNLEGMDSDFEEMTAADGEEAANAEEGTAPSISERHRSSVADFALQLIRGWRLLRAFGMDHKERNNILAATRNSLKYDAVVPVIRQQWLDDDVRLREKAWFPKGKGKNSSFSKGKGPQNASMLESSGNIHYLNGDHNDPPYHGYGQTLEDAGEYSYSYDEEEWDDATGGDWGADVGEELMLHLASKSTEDHTKDSSPELLALVQAEEGAKCMALESMRTLAQAREAVQKYKRERGFGKGKGSLKVSMADVEQSVAYVLGKGANGGKSGRTGCFICGGSHWARECPDRKGPGARGPPGKAFR